MEMGLIFCGSNAWKAERISTVKEVFSELFSQKEQVAICSVVLDC